jgi:hypothetical protein
MAAAHTVQAHMERQALARRGTVLVSAAETAQQPSVQQDLESAVWPLALQHKASAADLLPVLMAETLRHPASQRWAQARLSGLQLSAEMSSERNSQTDNMLTGNTFKTSLGHLFMCRSLTQHLTGFRSFAALARRCHLASKSLADRNLMSAET